jgi:hypothetical protein
MAKNRRGREIKSPTKEQLAAREKAAADRAAADAARPVNTIQVKTRGRNNTKVYQRWDGKQWLTATGPEVNKYKSLYANQQGAKKKPSGNKPPSEPPKPKPPAVPPRPAKERKKEDFTQLRYPKDAIEEGQDFIKFDILTYKRGGFVTRDDNNLKGKLVGTVILPIPSQIGDNNVANFGPGNMNFMEEAALSGATSLIGGDAQGAFDQLNKQNIDGLKGVAKQFFATEAVKALGSNITLEQVLARSQGAVINPNMELLFSGPGLRQFKFTFKFTPRYKEEGVEVKKIIKAFKRNMAPKGSGDNFLSTPNIFQINYMEGSNEHPFLNKFKLCALTNMSVNYTGDGVHATYVDGTPISMQMDLSFSELTPIYNEDYNEIEKFEKGHLGVGY